MKFSNKLSAFAAGVMMLSGATTFAGAADLPSYKSAPVPTETAFPLDVHGFADLNFASSRVNPGGLLIYRNRGTIEQLATGLSIDIYKNKANFFNSFSIFGGVWNEYMLFTDKGQHSWQEMDHWFGASVGFADYFKLSAQMLPFNFPNGGGVINNYVFSLNYDDSHFGMPVVINPYVNLFYSGSGPSTVVLGRNGKTYRVEIGMIPTVDMKKYIGVPLTLSAPTYITVGPTGYWNAQNASTKLCGSNNNAFCATSNVGVFSTGLQAKYSLEQYIPKRFGSWYIKGGVQYHHIMNDALRASQVVLGAASTYNAAKRDVAIISTGIGFSF